jgi:Glyoxalase superfamily protein/Clp amino terminal domain, pathogenicity island component
MRDFHDAKAIAHTLRATLAAQGLKLTNSQSLELTAEAFGVANWNTLSASIKGEARAAREDVSQPSASKDTPVLPFSTEFAESMRRALSLANQRKQEYATLEHLLLALIDDPDASAAMKASNPNLGVLKANLVSYIDHGLKRLVVDNGLNCQPSPAFQRVVQRAGLQAKGLNRPMVSGGDALLAIFAEAASPAVRLLGEQGISRETVANLMPPQ